MPPDPNDQDQPESESGEYVELDGELEDRSVVDNEDGSAYVIMDDATEAEEDGDFLANLADGVLPEAYLDKMASELLDLIAQDQQAREKRDKDYAECLRRSGLADPPTGAEFEGSSIVVHPMIIEAAIDFEARISKELMPPEGPVKDKIIGKATAAKVEKAARKVAHMNWQLTEQIKEFRSEFEQGLTQIPMGGAFYLKTWWGHKENRPRVKAVFVDDVLLPYSATSFESAQRRTHVIYVTEQEFKADVEAGLYIDMDMMASSQEPDTTETAKVNEKVEGKEKTGYNEDGLRIQYETQIWLETEDDPESNGELRPYIITIDLVNRKIVGWYRNWDPLRKDAVEELDCMTEFPFIPWRGVYPLSLWNLIGQLSVAASGSLRALLDSGFVNTVPTLVKLKGGFGSDGGQSKDLQPTGVTEIDGGIATDDVRKSAFPVQFNSPSATLFQLLGFLVDAGKGVIRTTMEDIADVNANTPVGTTLARYEQGMVVYSSIFGRLHAAMAKFLRILHRLNRFYLKESAVRNEAGEILAKRSDYEGPVDVVPVSDPRIYSDTQRQIQISTLLQRATQNPLYDQREVEKLFLEQYHYPDADRLLIQLPVPKRMNAVNENLAATMGKPIAAFPEQGHLEHLAVHLAFMQSPFLGQLPVIAPIFIPMMLGHIKEHVSLWYVSLYHDAMSHALGVEVTDMMDADDEDVMMEFDKLVVAATPTVMKVIDQKLASLPPVIQQAMQLMQSMQPQPQDPAAQAMMAETQRKTADDQTTAKLDAAKVQLAAQKQAKDDEKAQAAAAKDQTQAQVEVAKIHIDAAAKDAQLKAQQDEADAQRKADAEQALQALADSAADRESEEKRTAAEIETKHQMNVEDNITAVKIAEMEIEHDDKVAVSTGTGINP